MIKRKALCKSKRSAAPHIELSFLQIKRASQSENKNICSAKELKNIQNENEEYAQEYK